MAALKDKLNEFREVSEKISEELALLQDKQETYLKKINGLLVEKTPVSVSLQQSGQALIKETEALLKKLAQTSEQQQRELEAHGVTVQQHFTTGNAEQDRILQQEAHVFVERIQSQAKEKIRAASPSSKPAKSIARKQHTLI